MVIEEVRTAADALAFFIEKFCFQNVFLVNGGACAFLIDAIGRNSAITYTPFQHEQSAAMASDSVWRTIGKVGVTVSTSGPGATNLITGIACSWFDSIPSFHITGQVNQSESRESIGANVRQAGFQETEIATMVESITKKAIKVGSVEDLLHSLPELFKISTSGRMGPVLIDIPMNIQKEVLDSSHYEIINKWNVENASFDCNFLEIKEKISRLLGESERPLVLFGAGAGKQGKSSIVQDWCEQIGIPFVASWGGVSFLNGSSSLYQGSIGVYGQRHANFCIQSADLILSFGSRLDNRQRTGNPSAFAPFAKVAVFDIDEEELAKFASHSNFELTKIDLKFVKEILPTFSINPDYSKWTQMLDKSKALTKSGFDQACEYGSLNPYFALDILQSKFKENSVVVVDTGANLCWTYQTFIPGKVNMFTAGGNSPMGYSLPAAIGAAFSNPDKLIYCIIGDGGLQMNIQELQTVYNFNLNIKIVIQNNSGYGIIKQFQDSYLGSRHFATGDRYSVPNFGAISTAYGLKYSLVSSIDQLNSFNFTDGPEVLEITYDPNTLITPKTEMDRFLHDQFPYIEDGLSSRLPYKYPARPSELNNLSNPTV